MLLLPAAEGGRRPPIASGYRPQFFFRTASVSGMVDLERAATAMPGERLTVVVELGKPVALDRGLGFVIREGGKTVGAGTITSVDFRAHATDDPAASSRHDPAVTPRRGQPPKKPRPAPKE